MTFLIRDVLGKQSTLGKIRYYGNILTVNKLFTNPHLKKTLNYHFEICLFIWWFRGSTMFCLVETEEFSYSILCKDLCLKTFV